MSKNHLALAPYPAEILLNNRLDKEVLRMFQPFNIMQTIFLSSKYRIRDNYITPSEKKVYIPRFVSVCFVVAASIYRIYRQDINRHIDDDNTPVMFFLSVFLPTSRCLGFVLTFVLNIVYSRNNVLLVVLIQVIYKDIGFSKSVRSFNLWSWILMSVSSISLLSFVIIGLASHHLNVTICVVETIFLSFEIDYVYAVQVILLLVKYLDAWINKVHMMNDGEENDQIYCLNLLKTYQNILKAFDVYKTVSQVLILHRTVTAFCRNLCIFELVLRSIKIGDLSSAQDRLSNTAYGICSMSGIAKDVLQVILHCISCEKFYITVEEAEMACIQRLKNGNYTKHEERLCKNVLLENRSFIKMTACGLFYIDGALPMYFMGLLTTYDVVLLQFAFL